MKNMKKLIAMLLCLMLSMSMLAGCGTSDTDSDNGSNSGEKTESSETTASTPKNIFDSLSKILDMESGSGSIELTVGGSEVSTVLAQYLGSESLKVTIDVQNSEDGKNGVVTAAVELDGSMTDALEVILSDGTAYINVSKLLNVAGIVAAKIDESYSSYVELMKSAFTQEYIGITSEELTQLVGQEIDLSDLTSLYEIAGAQSTADSELSAILSDEEKLNQYVALAVEVMGDKTAEALSTMLSQDGTTSKMHLGTDNFDAADAQATTYVKDVLPGLLDEYAAKLKENFGESDALYAKLAENLDDIKSDLAESAEEFEDATTDFDGTMDLTLDVTGEQGSRTVAYTVAFTSDEVTLNATIKSVEGQFTTVTAPTEYMSFSELSALMGLDSDEDSDYSYDESTDDTATLF